MLHDAPLPPWPGESLDEIASDLDRECEWLVTNGVLPTDMVPDFLVGFGFTDDAAVLATTIGMVGAHINEQHRRRARESLLRSDTPNDFEEGVAS